MYDITQILFADIRFLSVTCGIVIIECRGRVRLVRNVLVYPRKSPLALVVVVCMYYRFSLSLSLPSCRRCLLLLLLLAAQAFVTHNRIREERRRGGEACLRGGREIPAGPLQYRSANI